MSIEDHPIIRPPTPIIENGKEKVKKPKKIFRNPTKRPRTGKRPVILPAHREIFQLYKDNGFKSLSKAIRQTGVYSPAVESHPNVITKSKSWQMLMNEYLPEEKLALRHQELLNKRDVTVEYDYKYGENGKLKEKVAHKIDNGPDTNAVSKGLEMAYRLRGSFTKEDTPPPSTVMYNLFYKPEVREQMKVFEDGIKQSLLHEINKRNLADIEAEEENQANLERGGPGESKEGVEQPSTNTAGE